MNSAQIKTKKQFQRWLPTGILAVLGLSIGTATLVFLATHPDPPLWWWFEIATTATISTVVAYSGYWLVQSDYDTGDLWDILGWSIAGVIAAVLIAGEMYVHQTIEHVTLAEPAFLFEFLALTGSSLGLAVGVRKTPLTKRRFDSGIETVGTADSDTLLTVLPLLDPDSEELSQRWTLLQLLLNRNTPEAPLKSFYVQLSKEERFPDDEKEVARLVEETHLPVLVDGNLVEIHDDRGTVRYTGPQSVAEDITEEF